jgi:hypothetical protein
VQNVLNKVQDTVNDVAADSGQVRDSHSPTLPPGTRKDGARKMAQKQKLAEGGATHIRLRTSFSVPPGRRRRPSAHRPGCRKVQWH